MNRFLPIAFAGICFACADQPAPTTSRAQAEPPARGVHTRFAGVSTLLISDGSSSVLIDGFFSRPRAARLVTTIAPDETAIEAGLKSLGGSHLDGIVVAHSHYDHGLDAGRIAAREGICFFGSESAANIARGAGVPPERIRVLEPCVSRTIGHFKVTAFPTPHVRSLFPLAGKIEQPLRPPVPVGWYRVGDNFTFLIEHAKARLLIVPSANYVTNALKGREADTVFLSIAQLGNQPRAHTERLWEETVRTVKAKRVVLIHWDDFTRALEEPLHFLPAPFDHIPKALENILTLASRDGVVVQFNPLFAPIDL